MDINTGFYMRWGPVFPLENYSLGQFSYDGDDYYDGLYWDVAKIGISAELGSHFYTGPSFANKYLRVGIDVTYMNIWFNPTESSNLTNWYWFAGQKVGLILTVSFPGGIMFDYGFKIAPTVSRSHDIWGRYFNKEIMMNFKFHELQISFQYCLGKMNYTDFAEKQNLIDIPTFRILLGMKLN